MLEDPDEIFSYPLTLEHSPARTAGEDLNPPAGQESGDTDETEKQQEDWRKIAALCSSARQWHRAF